MTTRAFLLLAGLAWVASPGYLTRTGDMTEARACHTMTVLDDGRVFIAGGFAGSSGEGSAFRTTELFDPATNRFQKGPAMLRGRSGHTATSLPDGRVLLAGGWANGDEPFGTAELDDPSGQRPPQAIELAVPRAGHTATKLRDGRILIVGGVDRADVELASAEIFDPRTGTSTRTGDMQFSRAAHTATLLPDGRVAIVGGGEGRYPRMNLHREIEIYDPATNRFTVAGELRIPRHKHAAALLPGGRLLVVGGSDNRDWNGRYDSAEIFDIGTGKSGDAGTMKARRFKIGDAVVNLGSGRVAVAGGAGDVEIFDAEAGRFYRTVGSFGASLFYSTAAVLHDGRVLIAGGYSDARDLPATRSAFVFSAR